MGPVMPLAALLLTRDANLLSVVRRSFEDLAIRPQVCAATSAASELILRRKFEAIVVDCDDMESGRELLRSLRTMPSSRNSIVIGVVHKKTSPREVFEMGANFVLEKPVTPERALKTLRAAHPLFMRERRRSFRQSLDTSVMLNLGPGPEMRARGVNLSEGGASVVTPSTLAAGTAVRFRFMLPDTDVWLDGRAQVVWSKEQGRIGLQFVALRSDLKVELGQWLALRLDQEPTLMPMSAQSSETRPRRDPLFGFTAV